MNRFKHYLPFIVIAILFYLFVFNLHFSEKLEAGFRASDNPAALSIRLSSSEKILSKAVSASSSSSIPDVSSEDGHSSIEALSTIKEVALNQKPEEVSNAEQSTITAKAANESTRTQTAASAPEQKPRQTVSKKPEQAAAASPEQTTSDSIKSANNLDQKNTTRKTVDMKTAAEVLAKPSSTDNQPAVEQLVEAQIDGDEKPRYPRMAVIRNQQGKVVVRLWVDENGKGSRFSVITSSSHRSLDNAVLDYVERARFIPAREGDIPIGSFQQFTFIFRLED